MAATGGGTIIPTNWTGLIATVALVAILALATYFGADLLFGGEVEQVQDESKVTLDDVFAASAKRTIGAVDTARATARAVPEGGFGEYSSKARGAAAAGAGMDQDDYDDDYSNEPTRQTPASASAGSNKYSSKSTSNTLGKLANKVPGKQSMSESAKKIAGKTSTSPSAAANYADDEEGDDDDWSSSTSSAASTASGKVATASSAAAKATSNARNSMQNRSLPPADALDSWWGASTPTGALSVRFAGPLDRGDRASDAIALMFSEIVDPASVGEHVTVTNPKGDVIEAVWQSGRNPKLVYLEGLTPGRYLVSIEPGLTGSSGKALAAGLQGPVFVY